MAGALMQLVAYGAQDVYLTGNPQITFFKVVYKRHTNFAMQFVQQTVNGTPSFGSSARVKISRAGDLLHDTWVNVGLPPLEATYTTSLSNGEENGVVHSNLSYCNRVGFRLLKSVELRIGGQLVDRHNSLWMHLWTELTTSAEKKATHGLHSLVGNKGQWHDDIRHNAGIDDGGISNPTGNTDEPNPYGVCGSGSSQASNSTNADSSVNLTGAFASGDADDGAAGRTGNTLNLWVPLQFSFCRNPGLALPLVALQYHEVELVFELETFANCLAHGVLNPRRTNVTQTANANMVSESTNAGLVGVNATPTALATPFQVWSNYIFLDTEERKNFAQNPHEYLIETVQDMQTNINSTGRRNYRLNFNHPVKELIWCAQKSDLNSTNGVGYSGPAVDAQAAGESALHRINIIEAQTAAAFNVNGFEAAGHAEGGAVAEGHVVARGASTAGDVSGGGIGTNGITGTLRGGDIFTDFTANATTLYLHPTNNGKVHEEGEAHGVTAAENAGTDVVTRLAPAVSFPGTISTVRSSVLRLNGQERFAERTSSYFNRVQPYQHHTGCPDLGINCYSFALKPEEHQPSGTCNFSRIDNAELMVDSAINTGTLNVFAHGYNVLRVASGMGGLAYSN